ncbi:endophilin-A isoform X3 [Dendroctonus ponderosae]|uniref:endophilin-A isoform X3 n=1 Tax=Dendroctonus ponderosae TaxID=77166 RepID=UPI002035F8BE|nr:endophilin-A isoform X3 [Dendroctonus ponderosae]
MAFAGLKKQINKANQYVTEKMGGAEGTKLDLDFMDMERKTDVTVELVEELQVKTKEFLQPNPTARAKMAAVKGISKLSGQAKSNTYPQPEGVLGDCMLIYGRKLGDDSMFGNALVEMGEALKQMADVKYSLDDNIKQNFLEPLHHLQTKDLKEVIHHRKKLQGRRLDFDCKRRRQAKALKGLSPYSSPAKVQGNAHDDEIKAAEEKFAESLHLAQMGMFNLLENDVEQISQLATFAEGLLDYHNQCTDILKTLTETLQEKREEAANRPKVEFVPKTLSDLNIEGVTAISDGYNGTNSNHFNLSNNHSTSNSYSQSHKNQPTNGVNEFRRPAPKTVPIKQMPPPDPFDPWSFSEDATTDLLTFDLDSSVSSSQLCSPQHKPQQLELHPGQQSANASPLPSPMKSPARTPMTRQPCCTALYDFDAENPGELSFKENDIITLLNKIDENWFEGSVGGRTGYFPVNYVKVDVPLP